MSVREILLLGNPKLYETCDAVEQDELPQLEPAIQDLHDTLMDFRERYGAGRAVAAPQIGVMKRLIYMHINEPQVFFNPELHFPDEDRFTLWDDCMSFPDLLVKVERYKRCSIRFRDASWKEQSWDLEGDLSELLQHECDHLDGILAVQRALDDCSFALRSQRPNLAAN